MSRIRRLPRPALAAGVVVATVGAVALGAALLVPLWSGGGSAPAPQAALVAAGPVQDDVLALRMEERTTRDRYRPPAPTPTPTRPAVVGQRWVTTDVAVRSGPSTDRARIGSLKAITKVDVTGVAQSGWTQVVLTGVRVGWVKSTYLSTSKPKPQPKPVPAGLSDAPCPISSDIEVHLTANARSVYRSVCATFGSTVSSFGGYRAGDSGDHGAGKALDIMVSGDPGLEVARYVQAHARQLGVTYVIYQQKIWMAGDPTSQWKLMEDRGGTTANHYDHVHVSVS